jgi:hypothetical protein
MSPTVSVVIAAFDGASLVGATIESVLAQSFTDFEIVVVDDCSRDDTLRVLRAFTDPRVRVLQTPHNMGPVGARNLAVEESRGRYIAALDQDDLCLPDRLARQVAAMEADPSLVVLATRADLLTEGRRHARPEPAVTTPGFLRWLLHLGNPLVWSTVMIRTEAARRLEPFSRQERLYAEDFDLYHRLSAFGTVARLDEVHLLYRVHPGGASQRYRTRMAASSTQVLEEALTPGLGIRARDAAERLVAHAALGRPVEDRGALLAVTEAIRQVNAAFGDVPDATSRALIAAHGSALWWRVARAGLRHGTLRLRDVDVARPDFARAGALGPTDRGVSRLVGAARAGGRALWSVTGREAAA